MTTMEVWCGMLSLWQSANACAYKGVYCSARVSRRRRDDGGRVWPDGGVAMVVAGVDLNRADLGGTLSDNFLSGLAHLMFLHLNSLEHGEKTRRAESTGLREEEQSAVARRGRSWF
jgi:hypothetical protein